MLSLVFQDEANRIKNEGGIVSECQGIWRVDGQLAVSRAIGESHIFKINLIAVCNLVYTFTILYQT